MDHRKIYVQGMCFSFGGGWEVLRTRGGEIGSMSSEPGYFKQFTINDVQENQHLSNILKTILNESLSR